MATRPTHSHRGDETDQTLARAIRVFVALAIVQLLLAFVYGRHNLPADVLFVAGLHNLLEYPFLGALQRARRIDRDHQPSWWACYAGPASPVWTTGLTLLVAGFIGFLELLDNHPLATWPAVAAALLEAFDFYINRHYAVRLHHHHDHGTVDPSDRMGHATDRHLQGDARFAFCGIGAFATISLGGPWWCDPLGAFCGIMCIVHCNWSMLASSWADTWSHRGHGKRQRLGLP